MLSAFAINFSKSLSTLNALEFNKIGIKSLHDILNNNPKYIKKERLVRIFTALIFIVIEKELYDTGFYDIHGQLLKMNDLKNMLFNEAIIIFIMYSSLLYWFYFLMLPNIKTDEYFTGFRKYMPRQFWAGLFIAFCYLGLSFVNAINFSIATFILNLLMLMLSFFYYRFFASIYIMEKKFLAEVKPYYDNNN